jgi:hypothetical protein
MNETRIADMPIGGENRRSPPSVWIVKHTSATPGKYHYR